MKPIVWLGALGALLMAGGGAGAQTPAEGPTLAVSVSPETARRGETVTYTVTAAGGAAVKTSVDLTARLTYLDPLQNVTRQVEASPIRLTLIRNDGAVKNPVLQVTVPEDMTMVTDPSWTGITGGYFQVNAGMVKVSGSEIPADTTATVTWKMQVK